MGHKDKWEDMSSHRWQDDMLKTKQKNSITWDKKNKKNKKKNGHFNYINNIIKIRVFAFFWLSLTIFLVVF
jgi:hypothetical protein